MEKIYTANYRCKDSIFTAFSVLFQQAVDYRWQIGLAIKKKIHATYQQDVFGLFWSIVMPIVPMTVYIVLARIKVFKTVEDMPPVYYIVVGMLVWLLMATAIQTLMLSIKAEKSILSTTNFPIFATLLSGLGEVLHDTVIRFIVLIIVIIMYQIDVNIVTAILALLSLIPAIVFALGVGMILSILDVVAQDARRIVFLVLRYGLFVSSVIFPFPESGIAGAINQFNFFNTFVHATRDVLHHGYIDNLELYLYTSLFGMVVFIIAVKLVYIMDYKIRAFL